MMKTITANITKYNIISFLSDIFLCMINYCIFEFFSISPKKGLPFMSMMKCIAFRPNNTIARVLPLSFLRRIFLFNLYCCSSLKRNSFCFCLKLEIVFIQNYSWIMLKMSINWLMSINNFYLLIQ